MTGEFHELIERANELHKRHRVGEHEDGFNVFSVLLNETDEVNLHSKFIAALLQHNPYTTAGNLDEFLRQVLGINGFDRTRATIRREYLDIDILISNVFSRQAIVIENKIFAEDQQEQLVRYHQTLKSQGFCEIYLVYLTLDGRAPSSQSVGDLSCKRISYKDHILPWLKCCQQRAQNMPSLRESIAQYIQTIKKLTGTNIEGIYMHDLSKLCLQVDNLLLVHDLNQAAKQVRIRLLRCLWMEIEDALNSAIPEISEGSWTVVMPGYPVATGKPTDGPDLVRFLDKQGAELVLRFPKSGVYGAGIGAGMAGTYFGVYCRDDQEQHESLRSTFGSVNNKTASSGWPWYQYSEKNLSQKDPTREQLKMLLKRDERSLHANEIATIFKDRVWDRLRTADKKVDSLVIEDL